MSALVSAQQPAPEIDVDVGEEGSWWTSGWIVIGIVAIVFLVLLVALAGRGGGTTVIKD